MSREVRRVPKDWEHPVKEDGFTDVPLLGRSFSEDLRDWEECNEKWNQGQCETYAREGPKWGPISEEHRNLSYTEYNGPKPLADEYAPDWPDEERTHYQMYQTTSEGTPISPVFETPEELARWLTDNDASAFGGALASYEAWLRVCRGGFAPSMVADSHGKLTSGVEGIK